MTIVTTTATTTTTINTIAVVILKPGYMFQSITLHFKERTDTKALMLISINPCPANVENMVSS